MNEYNWNMYFKWNYGYFVVANCCHLLSLLISQYPRLGAQHFHFINFARTLEGFVVVARLAALLLNSLHIALIVVVVLKSGRKLKHIHMYIYLYSIYRRYIIYTINFAVEFVTTLEKPLPSTFTDVLPSNFPEKACHNPKSHSILFHPFWIPSYYYVVIVKAYRVEKLFCFSQLTAKNKSNKIPNLLRC